MSFFRADYWVSNDRKFCDFCKCWIADNKPSIAFHEGGKRHKENVAKRLTEISKQSAKDERTQQKVDQQMREMEDAAMRAYAGDIGRGADMTSRAIAAFNEASGLPTAVSRASGSSGIGAAGSSAGRSGSSKAASGIGPQLEVAADDDEAAFRQAGAVRTNGSRPGPAAMPRRAIDPMMPPVDVLEAEERERRERLRRRGIAVPADGEERVGPVPENSMWCEAKSDDGNTYYWNVKTNATVWEEPPEGYMTLREYERINQVALQQQAVAQQEDAEFMRGNADEIVAKYAREKLKTRRAKPSVQEVQDKEEEQASYATFEDPETEARPLGQWQTVKAAPLTAAAASVDLQLPTVKHDYVYVPAANVAPEPPVKKFKEKVITALAVDDASAGVSNEFRKRKGAVKRNVRQRLDDD